MTKRHSRGKTPCVHAKRRSLTLVIVFMAAFAVRLLWIFHRPLTASAIDALPDQREYLELAKNWLAGRGLQFYDSRFAQVVWAYRTPGYPALIALLSANLRLVQVVQAALDASLAPAVYLLARRWLDEPLCLLAAVLVAINPLLIFFSGLLLSDSLFTAMLTWSLVLLSRDKPGSTIAGLLALSISVLVRPSALALPAIMGLAKGAKAGILGAGSVILILFPWALRNHDRLGAWIWTTTNSGITQYDGFNPAASGGSDQTFLNNLPETKLMGEVERNRYLGQLAGQYALAHPVRSLELAVVKLARTWSPVPLSAQYGGNRLYWLGGMFFSLPVLILAIVGVARGGLSGKTKIFLLTPILYFSLVHAASVGSLRYRLPLEPILAILAAAALTRRVACPLNATHV